MAGIWVNMSQVGYFHMRSTEAFPFLPGIVVCAHLSLHRDVFLQGLQMLFDYSRIHLQWLPLFCVCDVGNWFKGSGTIISGFKAYNFDLLIGCPSASHLTSLCLSALIFKMGG